MRRAARNPLAGSGLLGPQLATIQQGDEVLGGHAVTARSVSMLLRPTPPTRRAADRPTMIRTRVSVAGRIALPCRLWSAARALEGSAWAELDPARRRVRFSAAATAGGTRRRSTGAPSTWTTTTLTGPTRLADGQTAETRGDHLTVRGPLCVGVCQRRRVLHVGGDLAADATFFVAYFAGGRGP